MSPNTATMETSPLVAPYEGISSEQDNPTAFVIRNSMGEAITTMDENGWISASALCAAAGTRLDNFYRTPTFTAYVKIIEGM